MTKTVGARLIVREVYTQAPTGVSGIQAASTPRVVFDEKWSYESEAGPIVGDIDASINSLDVAKVNPDETKRQLFAIVTNYVSVTGTLFAVGSTTPTQNAEVVAVSYLWVTTERAEGDPPANARTCYGSAATFGTWLFVEGELEEDLNVLPGGTSTVDPLSA